jgi:hypothetical protein
MVRDSLREHHGAHDRHETTRVARERSSPPRKPRATWRRRLRSGPRRAARIPGRWAIRPRVTAIGCAHDSTGRGSRFARGCSRGGDRSTGRWLTERVRCGLPNSRCAHGSWSPAVAGRTWPRVSTGSSTTQSTRLLRAPSPYPFRDRRSWKQKRPSSAWRPGCATNGRCTREGLRCCRGCSATATVPRTTRMPEARCAMRAERSHLRLTVNGGRDDRREPG